MSVFWHKEQTYAYFDGDKTTPADAIDTSLYQSSGKNQGPKKKSHYLTSLLYIFCIGIKIHNFFRNP
jgi:hypothetical protein